MKHLIVRTVIALALVSLAGASALAGNKDRIKLDEAVRLGETTVEAGSYDVKFDEESGELSLLKGSKVVAKAKARSQESAAKHRNTTFTVAEENGGRVLRSVAFGGSRQIAIVGASGGSASGGTQ